MKFSNSKQNISRNKYILPWTGWKYLVENSISEFALEIQYQWKLCKHERNVFPWEKKKKRKKKKKEKKKSPKLIFELQGTPPLSDKAYALRVHDSRKHVIFTHAQRLFLQRVNSEVI